MQNPYKDNGFNEEFLTACGIHYHFTVSQQITAEYMPNCHYLASTKPCYWVFPSSLPSQRCLPRQRISKDLIAGLSASLPKFTDMELSNFVKPKTL